MYARAVVAGSLLTVLTVLVLDHQVAEHARLVGGLVLLLAIGILLGVDLAASLRGVGGAQDAPQRATTARDGPEHPELED